MNTTQRFAKVLASALAFAIICGLIGGAAELISGNYEREVLDGFASAMTKEELLYCADTVQDSLARIRQVRNPRTAAEICIVSLCDSRTAESVLSLRARISRLEEAVRSGITPVEQTEHQASAPKAPAGDDRSDAFLDDEPVWDDAPSETPIR